MPSPDIFPALKWCSKVIDSNVSDKRFFDIKWYPYPTEDGEQIFAACGLQNVVCICRPKENADPPFEVLRWWQHDDPDTAFNSIAWMQDPASGHPIVCVAGSHPRFITVLDVITGECTRTLQGHGKAVNDLAVSPTSKHLLASAAEDYTIRLWNLQPEYEEQPCVAVFSGGGHRQPLLSLSFHPNGNWLLSGAHDSAVAMWAVPPAKELDRRQHNLEPLNILIPVFFSTEVHAGYVDNVQFYGDLIISRSSKDQNDSSSINEILIWQIENFNSDDDAPTVTAIPEPGVATRSAFPHDPQSRGFRRIVTLDMPHTDRFYLRFGLLNTPDMRPILAMGNQQSRFSFWDLQRLEEGWDAATEGRDGRPKRIATSKNVSRGKSREKSATPSSVGGQLGIDGTEQGAHQSLKAGQGSGGNPIATPTERKFELDDPFKRIKPHAQVTANTALSSKQHFQVQQMAWSPDGSWLVAACDKGIICVFHRDTNIVNPPPKGQ